MHGDPSTCAANIPDCFTLVQRKENTIFIHVVLNASLWANILALLGGRCLVQETFIWSHTAFKRTCFTVDVNCSVVHAAFWQQWTAFFFFFFTCKPPVASRECSSLPMSELRTGCLFFLHPPPHSTELFQSSAVDFSECVRLNHDTVASPALSLFFACFVASSPKDFLMPLQGSVFCSFISCSMRRHRVLYRSFLHIRFLWLYCSRVHLLKTHQSHFCHQSFKTVELRSSREGADCTDSNYNQRRWWALYSKHILSMMSCFFLVGGKKVKASKQVAVFT